MIYLFKYNETVLSIKKALLKKFLVCYFILLIVLKHLFSVWLIFGSLQSISIYHYVVD